MLDDLWTDFKAERFGRALALASQRLVDAGAIDLLHIAGVSKLQLREHDEGIVLLKAAISFRPNKPHIYIASGQAMQHLGLADELEYFVSHGLCDFPHDRTLRQLRANVFLLRRDYATAIEAYEELIREDAHDVRPYINLGNVYRLLDQVDAAEHYFDKALSIEPDNATLRINRAAMCSEQNRLGEAMIFLEGVVDPDATYMRAIISLALGNYEHGWALHRQRFQSTLFAHTTEPPRALHDLSQVDGKPIAVLREGGFGDVFQFMRYLPAMAERASELLFHPLPSEYRLLRMNLPDTITLSMASDVRSMVLPDFYERSTALLDLPYLFNTTIETIPAQLPYIHVSDTIIAQHRLPPTTKKRVGLVWAGGPMTGINQRPYDAHRSIKLSSFDDFAELVDAIEFVNLQFEDSLIDDSSLLLLDVMRKDFDWLDTAAVVAQLDLIISVDTAMVHLSAAMGKPTWLLSRFSPCWRWLNNQPTSPWYPDVLRVFGQTRYGDWAETLTHVRQELYEWLHT